MKFICDQCQAQYMIADEKVGPKGVKVRCKKCSNIILVKKEGDEPTSETPTVAPESQREAPAADAGASQGGASFDDLFGNASGAGGSDDDDARQPTKVFSSADLMRVREEQLRAQGIEPPAASAPEASASETDRPEASASAPSKGGRQDDRPEWYLAIHDEQIGPVTMAEVEERWDRAEVNGSSLAWRAGLGDWAPVAQIPELAGLLSRAQATVSRPVVSEPVASPTAAPKEDSRKLEPIVSWRPSGASALADLAKEALVEAPKPEPKPVESPLGSDLPNLSAPSPNADPFAALPSFGQSQPAAPSTVWQFPQAAPRRSSTKWIVIGAVAASLLLATTVTVLALGVFSPRAGVSPAGTQAFQQPIPQPGAPGAAYPGQPVQPNAGGAPPSYPPPAGQPVAQPGVAPASVVPGQPVAPAVPQAAAPVAPTAPAPTGVQPAPAAPPAKASRDRSGGGEKPKKEAKADPPPAREEKPAKKEGGLDDLFAGGAGGNRANVKATLDRNDVLNTVKANLPGIKTCVESYVSRNAGAQLPAKLMLKWVIKPSGSTDSQELASPELKGTPVEPCVVAAIRKWKFPEYQSGNIPVTFPVPLQ